MISFLFHHIVNAVEVWFAGEWTGIWHKGVIWGFMATCVGLAFGSQLLSVIPFFGDALAKLLAPLRKDLLWGAFGCALILGGEYVGDHDARKACVAKQVVVEHIVTDDVSKVHKDKRTKDPWDNPKY